jgi:two-component system response regulator YesN
MFRALIIDDEKPARTAISALGAWSVYGIEPPFTATNGKDGLKAMRELQPDIVFIDMEMPVMDGIQFLQEASLEFPEVQFIVVSGYDEFHYAQAAIKNGAIDYLLKPVVAEELNKALKKAVSILNNGNITETDISSLRIDNPDPNHVIEVIKDYIDKNYCTEIRLSMFREKYFFSKEYLSKRFKQKYGVGIYEYALKLRMERAKELLMNDDLQIQEISERLGYSNNNYFSKAFKNYYGLSPTDFREKIQSMPDN